MLFALVDAIELEAASAERAVLDALEFIRANRDRRGDWIEESTVHTRDGKKVTVAVDIDAFAGPMWKRTLRDKRRPGMLARRHLEVCVFSHLAAELRSGDIAVAGSDSYANLHSQLMSWEDCEPLVAGFCEQAGIPPDAKALVAYYRAQLTRTATTAGKGYPANTGLRLEGGRPVLARRTGADRRPSALALEAALLDRLPERHLLDILARTAYLTGWPRHFGPASGSDPKIRDTLGPYVVTAFAYGRNLGPTEVARHMRGISAHEIYTAGNKHSDPDKIYKASTDVINAFAKLDVASMWGDGQSAAVDGSQIDTWENNLLAESSHIRYGGFGALAFRLVSDTYIALFSHFIPCGVWDQQSQGASRTPADDFDHELKRPRRLGGLFRRRRLLGCLSSRSRWTYEQLVAQPTAVLLVAYYRPLVSALLTAGIDETIGDQTTAVARLPGMDASLGLPRTIVDIIRALPLVGPVPADQLQAAGDSLVGALLDLPGKSSAADVNTRGLSTRDLWMTVTGQRPRPSPRLCCGQGPSHRRRGNFRDDADVPDPHRPTMDIHWLVSLNSQVPETPVAAWPARVPGRGRRCWPWGEQGPHDLSGVAWCGGVAPLVTEHADDVQSATGLGEGPGSSRQRSRLAQVGDRTQQGGPGPEEAEPEQAEPEPGIAGYRQGLPQRAGHQFRHHHRDIVAAFCGAPPVQGGEGEVPGRAD